MIRRMLVTDFNLFFQKYHDRAPASFHTKNLMILHLAVLLQPALHARSGDITRSQGYTGEEYMKWDDIELRFRAKATVGIISKRRFGKTAKKTAKSPMYIAMCQNPKYMVDTSYCRKPEANSANKHRHFRTFQNCPFRYASDSSCGLYYSFIFMEAMLW